jgi:hypothetical protein
MPYLIPNVFGVSRDIQEIVQCHQDDAIFAELKGIDGVIALI